MQHILSAEQFNPSEIKKIFGRADYFKKNSTTVASRRRQAKLHQGRQICAIFFQPSTRTRLSFESAAVKLGLGLVSTENAREHSSSAKGETLEDTIRILNGHEYDIIVMRHYEAGAAARAAAVSSIPIINAGDGTGEHPTQALLDAYTIYKRHGRLDNLKVVMGGDLRYGRTIRSLSLVLSKYKGNQITYVSIPELQINDDVKKMLRKSKTAFWQTDDLKDALKDADVVYWTRLQAEYLKDPKKMKGGGFRIDKTTLKTIPKKAIIMHPLPRVDEIDPKVDSDPRAVYFEQAANGLYVRMALIDQILSAS